MAVWVIQNDTLLKMDDYISIIVPFRNRDIIRVKRFLESLQNQTNKQFDLILVDTGSDLDISEKIETLANTYLFTNYIYHDNRGQEFNRSLALNIGSQFAKGNYLYFTDIDLIFHSEYINHLYQKASPKTQVFTQVYLTDEKFFYSRDLFSNKANQNKCELSHKSGKGLLLISKELFTEIGGYDEFYLDWGVEDNDMYIRLLNYGVKEEWVDHENHPVYHQWHYSHANNFDKYPDKWLDDIAFYYIKNQLKCIRKNNKFKLTNAKDRYILNALKNNIFDNTILIEKRGTVSTKTTFYRAIWDSLNTTDIKTIKIVVPKFRIPKMSVFQTFFYKITSKILKLINSPFSVVYTEIHERYKHFIPEKDIQWFFRQIITKTELVSDYYIDEKEDVINYYIETNKTKTSD